MRVRDLMTTPVHTIRQDAPVREAAELLAANSITALPVLDNFGALAGMVSEGDLLRHRVPVDPTAHARRDRNRDGELRPSAVREVMTQDPVTTTADADVADVADAMLRYDVRSVPVVDGRRVIGIISRRDILRVVIRGDDVVAKEVQFRLDEYAGTTGRWTAKVTDGVVTVTGRYDDEVERTVVAVLARSVPGVSAVEQR